MCFEGPNTILWCSDFLLVHLFKYIACCVTGYYTVLIERSFPPILTINQTWLPEKQCCHLCKIMTYQMKKKKPLSDSCLIYC